MKPQQTSLTEHPLGHVSSKGAVYFRHWCLHSLEKNQFVQRETQPPADKRSS